MLASMREAGMERAPTTMPPRSPVIVIVSMRVSDAAEDAYDGKDVRDAGARHLEGVEALPREEAQDASDEEGEGQHEVGETSAEKALGPSMRMTTTIRGI